MYPNAVMHIRVCTLFLFNGIILPDVIALCVEQLRQTRT